SPHAGEQFAAADGDDLGVLIAQYRRQRDVIEQGTRDPAHVPSHWSPPGRAARGPPSDSPRPRALNGRRVMIWRSSAASPGVSDLRRSRVRLAYSTKGADMPGVSRSSASQVNDYGPIAERREDIEGTAIQFLTTHQDLDATPFMKGLPDDRC